MGISHPFPAQARLDALEARCSAALGGVADLLQAREPTEVCLRAAQRAQAKAEAAAADALSASRRAEKCAAGSKVPGSREASGDNDPELLSDVARFRQSEALEAVPEPRPASAAAAPPASGTAGAAADARTPAKRAAKPAKTPTRSLSKRLSSISPMRRRRPSEAPHEDALSSAAKAHAAFVAEAATPPPPKKPLRVPADYESIQAALDAAPTHGLVLVAPGHYFEALVVARAVEIEAEGYAPLAADLDDLAPRVVVEAPSPGHRALLVTAAGACDARGLALRCCERSRSASPSGESSSKQRPCAAVGVKGGELALAGCVVGSASALSGVNAQRGATLKLRDVRGAACRHTGVLLSGDRTTATLERCALDGNGAHGLEVQDGARVERARDVVCRRNALFGLFLSDADSFADLARCDLGGNARCGVWVQSGATARLADSTLANNAEHCVALSEPSSAAHLTRCELAGKDDHLACFNGAVFANLDAKDCCYETLNGR